MTVLLPLWIFLAHAVGDYILQPDWMAQEKTKRWWPAVAHGLAYSIPYAILLAVLSVPLWPAIWTLLIIGGTHVIIDHYRLAKHLIWAKERLQPKSYRKSWAESKMTGYPDEKPPFMSIWLMIITDNTIHLIINAVAFMIFVL